MVRTAWEVTERHVPAFLGEMTELRKVRLRTGACEWRLYRDVDDPRCFTEVFLTVTWAEHLRQHRRLDDDAIATIRRAVAFDRRGAPTSHHQVALAPDRTAAGRSRLRATRFPPRRRPLRSPP